MPTKDNCVRLEALLEAATALVETKKQVDRMDQEIRLAQERLGQGSAAGDGEDGEGDEDEDAMNIDEQGEADREEGRAQSVLSTRSGRARKQVGS
jgi:DNA methyltransferase 1-associated protein 1